MPRFRVIDHTADLGAYFYGESPEEVFVHAGLALGELMVEDPPREAEETIRVVLEGSDRQDLLVRWLSELLYLFHSREQVATRIEIEEFSPTGLTAAVGLAPFDLGRHGLRHEIKAATYHQVELERRKNGGWRARVFFDL